MINNNNDPNNNKILYDAGGNGHCGPKAVLASLKYFILIGSNSSNNNSIDDDVKKRILALNHDQFRELVESKLEESDRGQWWTDRIFAFVPSVLLSEFGLHLSVSVVSGDGQHGCQVFGEAENVLKIAGGGVYQPHFVCLFDEELTPELCSTLSLNKRVDTLQDFVNSFLLDESGSSSDEDEEAIRTIRERTIRFLDECGTNFVLVDIDYLIEEALNSDNTGIDWSDHGGQWLHVFFYCELKLREWRKSSMGFQILYLKGNDPIVENQKDLSSMRLLRHLLFFHLKKFIEENEELKLRHSCITIQNNIYQDFSEFKKLIESVNINSIVIQSQNKELLVKLLNSTVISIVTGLAGEGISMTARLLFYPSERRTEICSGYEGLTVNCLTMDVSKMSQIDLFEAVARNICSSNLDQLLGKVIVITKLLQDYLPLNYRYLQVDKVVTELNEFIQRFYGKFFEIVYNHQEYIEGSEDLLDGRLAHSILLWMIENKQTDIKLPGKVKTQLDEILNRLKFGEKNDTVLGSLSVTNVDTTFEYEFELNHEVLPINNRFMNEMFDIPESVIKINSNKKVFKDEYHYHNTEKISSIPVAKYKDDDRLNSLAKLVATFKRPKKTIVVAEKFTARDIKEELSSLQKKDNGRENYFKTTFPKRLDSWNEEFETMTNDSVMSIASKLFAELLYLKRLERKISNKEKEVLESSIKKVFELLTKTLFGKLKFLKKSTNTMQVSVWIRFLFAFLEEYSNNFPSFNINPFYERLVKESFDFKLYAHGNEIINRKSLKIGKSLLIEEVDVNQHYLETCETNQFSLPHPQQFSLTRVLKTLEDNTNLSNITPEDFRAFKIRQRLREDMDFIPDEWQEDLIKHVNQENVSVLCNVPTSQGKTFICFYLIEKVLRESSTDVICFIVPTKALVNQIYCEVSSRFDRSNLVGMATSATRINEFTSQVLIITPAMLEIYLLSPENADWKSRIKYLILDEIHSAFESEQAPFYEHIIQFLDCPILGLSATLENRTELANWMKHGKRQTVEIVYLEDYKRFNPLEYYSYNPNSYSAELCSHIHPIALLNVNNLNQEITLMNGMSMSECLILLEYLKKEIPQWYEQLISIQFKSDILEPFKWADAISYRRKIHELLIEKAQDEANRDLFCKLIAHFCNLSNISSMKRKEKLNKHEIVNLVMEMKYKEMLPSISFVFNKTLINNYLEHLVEYLESSETNLWKDGKPPKSVSQTIKMIEDGDCNYGVEELHVRAMKVGLACHFAALNENYQLEVERLFRIGDIPLIFATSTLALGVNMPCKTVVICGFSSFYTNGVFKQACGRAGRRGFDNKGRVILCGFNLQLQRRFLLSPPTMVNGSQGFPTSFTLRLFSSLSKKTKDLEEGIKRLLQKPLFSLDKNLVDRASKQMKHLFLFNTEYLSQSEYLNENCEPLSLSGLVTHLFYLNEKAFTIPHLVKAKFFEHFKTIYSDTEQDLLLLKILTYLIYRIRAGSYMDAARTIKLTDEENPIFNEMSDQIKRHNDMALSIYSNFASVYSTDNYEELKDTQLPLSNYGKFKKLNLILNSNEKKDSNKEETVEEEDDWENFDVEETTAAEESKESLNGSGNKKYILDESEFENDISEIPFIKFLSTNCIRNNISISSFAALSGIKDGHYNSTDQFLQTLNHNICLNKSTIPLQDIDNGRLNSFLLELYKHKQIKLLKRNGFATKTAAIREVETFVKDLKKIRSCLIVEKIFKDSTFYHPYMDSLIKESLQSSGIKIDLNCQEIYDQWKRGTLSANFDEFFLNSIRYKKFTRRISNLFRHPLMKCLDRLIYQFNNIIYGEPVYIRPKRERADIVLGDDEEGQYSKSKSKSEPKMKRPEDE